MELSKCVYHKDCFVVIIIRISFQVIQFILTTEFPDQIQSTLTTNTPYSNFQGVIITPLVGLIYLLTVELF